MSSYFSSYVRSLGQDGEPPTPESFDALLASLRGALVYEMRRRALWTAPPSYLGIYGGARWTDGDLFEEFVLDCYQFIFLRRLRGLKKQLLVRPNIDGLIFLNIRHFLHDAQKHHDPLGFRAYEIAHGAVVRLLAAQTLFVLAGDPEVHNDTAVGFAPWHDPQEAEGIDLRPQTAAWIDTLVPELITAWNREPVVRQLADLVAALPDTGVEVFRFRDLVGPLKENVCARWRSILLREEGETALENVGEEHPSSVQLVRPEHGFEDRQSFKQLVACMDESLERANGREKTRKDLHRLWFLLRQWASELDEPIKTGAELGERAPSDKRLGKLLDIPRGRIPELRATLGRMIKACHEAVSGQLARTGSGAATGGAGVLNPSFAQDKGGPMSLENRRERLRLDTGSAAARVAVEQARLAERAGQSSRLGDVYVVAATCAFPVEWVVVEQDVENPRRLWVAPFDDRPLVGSRDVTVAAADGSVAHVRCGMGTWVDVAVLDLDLRTGVLGAQELADVRRRRAAIVEGSLRTSNLEREVDADPEYTRWMSLLSHAENGLLKPHRSPEEEVAGPLEQVARIADHRGRSEHGKLWKFRRGVLAAGLAAVVAGLGLLGGYLGRQIDTATQPIVIRSSATHDLRFLEMQRTPEPFPWTETESHLGLYLDLSRLQAHPAYRLELLAKEGGSAIWDSGAIASDFEFFLLLPRDLLTAEEYRVRIYGQDEEGVEELLDERPVEIEYSE